MRRAARAANHLWSERGPSLKDPHNELPLTTVTDNRCLARLSAWY